MAGFWFASHSGLSLIHRIVDYKLEFAVMPYTINVGTSREWTSIRHPAETSENDETVSQTIRSGVNSEIAKDTLLGFRRIIFEPKPIHWDIRDDERCSGGLHLKLAIPVQVEGEVRDDRRQWDGDELHGKVEWVEGEFLLRRRMVKGASVKFHVDSAFVFFLHLAQTDMIDVRRYAHVLAEAEVRSQNLRIPSPQETAAVLAYCAR